MPRESPLPGRLFLCFSRSFFRHPKREKNYRQKVWIVHFITYFAIPYAKQGATRKFSEGHSVTQKIRPRILLGGKCLIFSQKSLSLRQETLNDSELHRNVRLQGRTFFFSGPARCDSRSGFPPHRPHRPRRPRRLLRFRPDRPDRTPGYASNRPVCFGAFH